MKLHSNLSDTELTYYTHVTKNKSGEQKEIPNQLRKTLIWIVKTEFCNNCKIIECNRPLSALPVILINRGTGDHSFSSSPPLPPDSKSVQQEREKTWSSFPDEFFISIAS